MHVYTKNWLAYRAITSRIAILAISLTNKMFAQADGKIINRKWGSQPDGTYINPVMAAYFSDIEGIKVGNGYYAISPIL